MMGRAVSVPVIIVDSLMMIHHHHHHYHLATFERASHSEDRQQTRPVGERGKIMKIMTITIINHFATFERASHSEDQ